MAEEQLGVSIDDIHNELTDSEKEAWSYIQDTINSPGFKLFQRDINEKGTALSQNIYHCQSWEQYVFIKGQLDALTLLNNLEANVLAQLNAAVEERRAANADVETPLEVPEDFL